MGLTRVAVITPHHSARPEWLRQCVDSVRAQTYPCDHFIVCDGVEPPPLEGLGILRFPVGHRDFGDTPRALGAISAFRQGYEAVAWLDDDNWFAPDHIRSLVEAREASGAQVATSTRWITALDGRVMGRCRETHPDRFIDCNCLLLHAGARWVANGWWMMREDLHIFDDRVLFAFMKANGVSLCHTGEPTVYYRSVFAGHYRDFGWPVPPEAKPGVSETYRKTFGKDPAEALEALARGKLGA